MEQITILEIFTIILWKVHNTESHKGLLAYYLKEYGCNIKLKRIKSSLLSCFQWLCFGIFWTLLLFWVLIKGRVLFSLFHKCSIKYSQFAERPWIMLSAENPNHNPRALPLFKGIRWIFLVISILSCWSLQFRFCKSYFNVGMICTKYLITPLPWQWNSYSVCIMYIELKWLILF